MFSRLLVRRMAYCGSIFQRSVSAKSDESIKVRFECADTVHEANGNVGDSLLDVVVNSDVPLDGFGACEGTIACCTCLVHLDKEHYDRLKPPGEEELDMLDLAPDLCNTSRLGCQVILERSDVPQVTVKVPSIIEDARSH